MRLSPIDKGDVELFDRVISTNLRGTFLVLAQAAQHVAAGGRIIAFSSSALAKSFPTYGPYIVSKAWFMCSLTNCAVETLLLTPSPRGRSRLNSSLTARAKSRSPRSPRWLPSRNSCVRQRGLARAPQGVDGQGHGGIVRGRCPCLQQLPEGGDLRRSTSGLLSVFQHRIWFGGKVRIAWRGHVESRTKYPRSTVSRTGDLSGGF
jgi:hypothetical protein